MTDETPEESKEITKEKAEEHLDAIFQTHGFQKEVMADKLYEVRRKQADDYTKELAEKDVHDFLETTAAEQDAALRLEHQRKTPIVSRESQLAVLKGMLRDYEKGVRRPGLSAHSVLKAAELINKMTGYEAPIEHKHEVEHKVNVLPIIQAPFKGELEPLEIIDLGDASIVDTSKGTSPPETPLTPEESKELSLIHI